jgi:hypothetical protein
VKVSDWDDMDTKRSWGAVLIDHTHGPRRAVDVLRFKDTAEYIVLHDTERGVCGYDTVWPHFKYRYNWEGYKRTAAVVSNFYPLDGFGEVLK